MNANNFQQKNVRPFKIISSILKRIVTQKVFSPIERNSHILHVFSEENAWHSPNIVHKYELI